MSWWLATLLMVGQAAPPLDLPEVVIEGVDRPARPVLERDPADTQAPETPDTVVRGAKASGDGAPLWLPLAGPPAPAPRPLFRLGVIAALGNQDWRELGLSGRGHWRDADLQAAVRGFVADQHRALDAYGALATRRTWSLAAELRHWERDLWGLARAGGYSDERSLLATELRYAGASGRDWGLRSRLRGGGARVALSERLGESRTGLFGEATVELAGYLNGARATTSVSTAWDPDLAHAELWAQLQRPTDRGLTFHLGMGGLAAHTAGESKARLNARGGVHWSTGSAPLLSAEISTSTEARSLAWWTTLPAPLPPEQLQVSLMQRAPRFELIAERDRAWRVLLAFERREDETLWQESPTEEGLWLPRLAEVQVLQAELGWPVGQSGRLGLWIQRSRGAAGEKLPYLAPEAWRASAEAELGPLSCWTALWGSSDTRTAGAQSRDGWITVDVGAVLPLRWGLELGLEAVNLLDESWFVWPGYEEPGTALRLSLRYAWDEARGRLPRVASWYSEENR